MDTVCRFCGEKLKANTIGETITALQDHYTTCDRLPKVGKDPGRITAHKHTSRR